MLVPYGLRMVADRVFEKLDSRHVLMADCKELPGEFDFEVFVVK